VTDIVDTAPTPADLEVLRASYAALKADRDALAAERDARAGELDKLRAERDDLATRHSESARALGDMTNKVRERDVLEGLRAAFPGADATTVRGAFLAAVEDGKAQRYPEDPAKALPALVELLKGAAPTLTRAAPVNGGGAPAPAGTKPAKQGFWNIGARTP